jgi:hypothetical protein
MKKLLGGFIMDKRIKYCKIKECGFQNVISVVYDDGSVDDRIGAYYPDEVRYSEDEFIGLTKRQASDLIDRRDKIYLRS